MGRKKNYDEGEVLERAMVTFWEKGYKNTSVRALEESMGINQFSIYASFRSKKELFKDALSLYEQYIAKHFLLDLQSADVSLNDIEAFLLDFATHIVKGKIPNSCFMVKTISELGKEDKEILKSVCLFFDRMRTLFHKALMNSAAQGLLKRNINLEQSTEYLVGIAQSISVYIKTSSQTQVESYIHFAISQLRATEYIDVD